MNASQSLQQFYLNASQKTNKMSNETFTLWTKSIAKMYHTTIKECSLHSNNNSNATNYSRQTCIAPQVATFASLHNTYSLTALNYHHASCITQPAATYFTPSCAI
jgi:hypothetical protein